MDWWDCRKRCLELISFPRCRTLSEERRLWKVLSGVQGRSYKRRRFHHVCVCSLLQFYQLLLLSVLSQDELAKPDNWQMQKEQTKFGACGRTIWWMTIRKAKSARSASKMLFTMVKQLPFAFFRLIQSCLPSLLLTRLYQRLNSILFSSNLPCSENTTTVTMDEYPERIERLEPLKTLHETRANDQYGK